EHTQKLAHAQRRGDRRERDDDRGPRGNSQGNPADGGHPRRDHRGISTGTLALSSGGAVVSVNAGARDSARRASARSGGAASWAAATRSTMVVSSGAPSRPYRRAELTPSAPTAPPWAIVLRPQSRDRCASPSGARPYRTASHLATAREPKRRSAATSIHAVGSASCAPATTSNTPEVGRSPRVSTARTA